MSKSRNFGVFRVFSCCIFGVSAQKARNFGVFAMSEKEPLMSKKMSKNVRTLKFRRFLAVLSY